ncbi:MAG: Uma2 family endonuclease [Gammaproteobacteria bacterium]
MVTTALKTDPQPPQQGLPLKVELRPVIDLGDDEFFEFCQINRDLRIERNAEGELLLMPPTGAETGNRNAEITMQLRSWAKRDGSGVSFDSSAGFVLPNKAVRSPDASWIKRSRLVAFTPEQRRKFLPCCPDFVLELRSPSDELSVLQAKMREYIDNGAQLGWLIDPEAKRVYVYRPETPVSCLEGVDFILGDPILPEFVLELAEIWVM